MERELIESLRGAGVTGMRYPAKSASKTDAAILEAVKVSVTVAEKLVKGKGQGPLKKALVIRVLTGILGLEGEAEAGILGLLVDLAASLLFPKGPKKAPARKRAPRKKAAAKKG